MLDIVKKCLEHRIVTNRYPARPVRTSPEFIGAVTVDISRRCSACGECASVCPSGAISVEPTLPGDTKVVVDLGKCVFCGYCVERCKFGVLQISSSYENADADRGGLIRPRVEACQARLASGSGPGSAETGCRNGSDATEAMGKALARKAGKLFGRSLQIREVDAGSCNGCDLEVSVMNNPANDIERFGIHFVASPRHADMLLVTGCPSRNMEEALVRTYEATPSPKLVVAVGSCAISGGMFSRSYAVKNGIDQVIPVDMYVPGCPPRPQAIMYGILKALNRVGR